MEASLMEILEARERRAQKQKALLTAYEKPLLCFTMNTPGPVKYSRDICLGFHVGMWLLEDALAQYPVLHRDHSLSSTGPEAYYIVDTVPEALKRLAIELEEIEPIGRLFDMDVITPTGDKLSREALGYPRRKCLLCDNDAAVCARSRAHGLEALQDRTGFLLYMTAIDFFCEWIAAQAYLALQQEVSATPKPGLVDRNNRGSHQDMDLRHFFASANALRPYFSRFAQTGFLTRDLAPEETFRRLRPIGMEAEEAMFLATHGVNTHKGAIFSMGLLCAAAGRLTPEQWTAETLLGQCAAMTQGLVAAELQGITPATAKTAGEKLYAAYGITGARGQAEAGFPAVAAVGLPTLRKALEKGLSKNDACCIALLYLLAAADDTNLIHRGSREQQLHWKNRIAQWLQQEPFPPMEKIAALDQEFIAANLSPGGTADLLAITYFVYLLTENGG